MNIKRQTIAFIGSSLVASLAFQNCSGSEFMVSEQVLEHSSESTIEKMNTCESILYNEFLKPNGYYSFLTQKCGNCHNGLGQAPGFASQNTLVAWDKFFIKEIESNHRISDRAIGDHQPGVTGTQNSSIIERLKEDFGTATIRFDKCEDEQGDIKSKKILKPLTTKALSLNFLKPDGEDLTDKEKKFLRTELLKYYVEEKNSNGVGTGIYNEKTQALEMNPYERPIYDTATNLWKKHTLKKVSSLELTTEEANHIRIEKYKLTDARGLAIMDGSSQKEKTYFLNPFQRIKIDPTTNKPVVDPKTFEPIVEQLNRGGEYTFNFRESTYTPELNLDEPYLTFKIQLFRSQRPITKTEQKISIKKRTSATTTSTINITRTISYTQTLDPYIVLKRPVFVLNSDSPSTIFPKYAYQVQNLSLILNNVVQSDRTIYNIIDSVVCEKTPINIMVNSNSEILPINFTKSNYINFEFKNVTTLERSKLLEMELSCTENESLNGNVILPDKITYAELMAAGSTEVNIFKKDCASCHSATTLAGGFDITSYDRAKERTTKIIERMNNANSPMPPTGLLNPTSRKLIEKWVNLGSPL